MKPNKIEVILAVVKITWVLIVAAGYHIRTSSEHTTPLEDCFDHYLEGLKKELDIVRKDLK